MLINITPLRKYRDFRLLYIGQLLSNLGSMVSYVAIPYQVYELTKDNWLVGMISIAQLVSVLIFGILGGTFADRVNRRKLLINSELIMCALIILMTINAFSSSPSIVLIFILVAIFQAVVGFHRPAMEALNQKLVDREDFPAMGALGSFRWAIGTIAGPAIGGLIIAKFGVKGAFLFDSMTFGFALIALFMMNKTPDPEKKSSSPIEDAKVGLKYAVSKPELVGTYLIDIVAMVFAFPVALFPAMSQSYGGAAAAGALFSSMAIGALVMTLFSGWTSKIHHRGRGVVIAATLWAVFIVALGFTSNLTMAILCLALAGAADMVSGLFRGVIWNETVPNEMRGRLSGIEMISYMTGPLLGNARAGWIASIKGVSFSIMSGGVICVVAVILTAILLPKFWAYVSAKEA